MSSNPDVIIVGGGLAGLAAAVTLEKAGVSYQLYEQSQRLGGRVKSSMKDGFILDHGFQVLLTEYDEAQTFFNYDDLKLQAFENGAYIYNGKGLYEIGDPLRDKSIVWKMLRSPIGSLKDKLKLAKLSRSLKKTNADQLFKKPSQTTYSFLLDYGFSESIIKSFFQPFFAGVFSDPNLSTCSRLMNYYMKCFAEGQAVVPFKGMMQLTNQLEEAINGENVFLGTRVLGVESEGISLQGGKTLQAKFVIDARSLCSVASKTPALALRCVYFKAPKSPLQKPKLCLNGTGEGVINHVVVMSDVSKAYSNSGSSLISVTLLGDDAQTVSMETILEDCSAMFGDHVLDWVCVEDMDISCAVPLQEEGAHYPTIKDENGVFLAGDWTTQGSIQGALRSGRLIAEEIINLN